MGEKWFKSANPKWYFLTPDGNVYHWVRGTVRNSQRVASLDSSYHDDPTKLINASERRVADTAIVVDAYFGLYSTGNLLEDSSGLGEKWLKGLDGVW